MISNLFGVAYSGLRAMEQRLAVSANNTANSLSDGFKKSRVILTETSGGGVGAAVEQVDTPGPTVFDPALGRERELASVDLAGEMIDQIATQRSFEADLKTIQAEDEMLGSLIDIIV